MLQAITWQERCTPPLYVRRTFNPLAFWEARGPKRSPRLPPRFMPWIAIARWVQHSISELTDFQSYLPYPRSQALSARLKKTTRKVHVPGFEPPNFRQLGRWCHQLTHRGAGVNTTSCGQV